MLILAGIFPLFVSFKCTSIMVPVERLNFCMKPDSRPTNRNFSLTVTQEIGFFDSFFLKEIKAMTTKV